MEFEVTAVDRQGGIRPLLVSAGEAATVGGLREALAEALGEPVRGGRPLHVDGEPVPDDRPLAAVPPPTGARLSLGRPPAAAGQGVAGPTASVAHKREIAVVGGLAGGASSPLPTARTTSPDDADTSSGETLVLGRSAGCDLLLDDPEISRRHAEARVAANGAVTVTDLGSRNGTAHRGYRTTGPVPLTDGDAIQLGETVVALRRREPADVRLEPDPAHGVLRFNRPPRIATPRRRPEVTVPTAPDKPRGVRFPLATVLLPVLLAAGLYFLLPNSSYYLIFLAFSPLMAVAYFVTERRGGHREYRDKRRAYEAEVTVVRERLTTLAVAEEHHIRATLPDPAALLRIATGPTGRLFERRPADDDFGRLRVGLHDRPADVQLTGGPPAGSGAQGETVPTVYAVPLVVDLSAAGVLGVAGPRPAVLSVARALLAQAAVLHAPHDLGVVLLTGADEAADWEWMTWLPHTMPHRADLACRRLVATDREQAEARIAELRRIMDERGTERHSGLRDQPPPGRRLLVLLDGARRLRSLPGLADLLADGPGLGVYAVCLDTDEASLPDECRATVVVTSASGSRVRVSRPGRDDVSDVLADGLPEPAAARIAAALAPVRVLGARFGDDGDLPERVRFLDLAGLGAGPGPEAVLDRWAAIPGGRGTEVLIGVDATGPVSVDLRRDGPHALIAGTSGAGKSELLQTLVASLALGNTPDALNLVLVDYKGGSAFAACRDLPHCVGMVTDLDGHLAARALTSLSAELRRRETVLAGAGAKDIEDYWARTGGRLPRLVIVIDEFATLVEEVPEFVSGVVGIGMRGRSLGVHVVLATQRPGGVVNAEIRANVNLRLCLRVTRAEESSDVVDVPDAARISRLHPGRAYLRTGHSDLTMVQCARVGWPRPDAGTDPAVNAGVTATRRRATDLGRARRALTAAPDGHAGETDLTALVTAVRAAAERAGVAIPASPWLPPLPELVTVAELDPVAVDPVATEPILVEPAAAVSPVTVRLGLADHPADQAQVPFLLDLERTGTVAVAGMARSGRSTLLRTLAASLAAASSPADVHLYVLDYGGRALDALAALPHCGACVDGDETDRVERLLDLLTAEVTRRGRLLAAGGFAALPEQRAAAAPADRLPYLVLLLDRYETFLARHAEVDGGRLVETLDGLLRQGAAVGILTVLTTDRSGFNHRLGSAVATRLVLRQADPDDVAVFGVDPRQLPRQMPAGRAIAVPGEVELQVAVLAPDASGPAQTAAVQELAGRLAARWDGIDPRSLPTPVDPLPGSITITELAALRTDLAPEAPTSCTVGAGGDRLGPVDVDLADLGGAFLVAGPARSGRSSALAALVTTLAGRASGELSVLLCCPRPSPLAALADLPGVLAVLRGPELGLALEDALVGAPGPVAVVVDDAELLADGPGSDVLERLARTARDDGNLLIAAGATEDLALQRYRGWLALVRRGQCGLLLNPSSYVDGEVLDVRLPRSTRGGWPPGRALLVRRGTTTAVQVPAYDPTADGSALTAIGTRPTTTG